MKKINNLSEDWNKEEVRFALEYIHNYNMDKQQNKLGSFNDGGAEIVLVYCEIINSIDSVMKV